LNVKAYQNPVLTFHANKFHLALASLTINLMALALPVMTLQVYDRLLVSESLGTLRVLMSGLVVVTILDSIIRLARSYVINWAGAAHEHTVYCNSMRHILAVELSAVEEEGSGTHLQRMSHISKLRDFFSGQALTTFIDLPFVFIFLGLIFYLAGGLVAVPLSVLIVFIALAWALGGGLRLSFKARENADRERLNFIIEALDGIHTIKSMALEPFFQRRYEQYQLESSKANFLLAKMNLNTVNYSGVFTQVMTIGIIGFGAPMAMEGRITLGTLIACVLLSARIMQPLQRVLGLWGKYQDFRLARDNVDKNFNLPVVQCLDPEDLGGNEGELEIKDLSFYYGDDPPVLNNVNLTLKRGEAISISGDRSTGKTTLLKLISGLYLPKRGEILVDGVEASKYPARELVKHVGLLPMEGIIFRGTIWDNLSSFGAYDTEAVNAITSLLDLDVDIRKLPAGYYTQLEGSVSDAIPPGLRQRIAIARALVPKPRIILFDNADRSLDKEGYSKVYRLLARLKGKVTMIIITDDKNMQLLAKKEYLISEGELLQREDAEVSEIHDVLPYQELRL